MKPTCIKTREKEFHELIANLQAQLPDDSKRNVVTVPCEVHPKGHNAGTIFGYVLTFRDL